MCDNDKWGCEHCTYLNYATARKCTMCGISKFSHLIVEAGEDIYKLANQDIPDEQKWTCSSCTYLNYPRSMFCTQCQSPHLGIEDQLHSLSLSKAESPLTTSAGSESRISCQQLGAGRVSPLKDNVRENEDQHIPVYKWRCRACTYENWPRSPKCVMCSTPKGSVPNTVHHPPARLATPPPPTEKKVICDTSSSPVTTEKSISQEPNSDSGHQDAHHNNLCKSINEINKNRCEIHEQTVMPEVNQAGVSKSSSAGSCRVSPPVISSQHQPAVSQHTVRGEGAMALNNYETERLLRQLRRRLREADWSWLNACVGVVEGNYDPVHAYLESGGDPMRKLTTTDVKILSRPSAFDDGHTLVHLAIRFGREDLLADILSRMDGGGPGVKRVPPYVAPDLAMDIKRHIATNIRQRKGPIPCYFVIEHVTFALPADIEDLPTSVQEQLFEEILDKDAQKQLEGDVPIINWSLEITERLGSRLYALWNRTGGDCLLDSVLQATWGVFDRDNVLRRAMADSLTEAVHLFYPKWKEYERWQARLLNYYVSESQLLEEWTELVCLASQPGSALEQLHIFVLAHVLRRPVIVYGVKAVKSFRGEDLGFARFEGVYLPLFWEPAFCWKSPVALGYTRGHFSALVPMEPDVIDNMGAGAILDAGEPQVVFLPLMTHDAKLLPVHFLTQSQIGCEEEMFRQWMEVCVTEGGILVAQQHLVKPPLTVAQMTQEWLNHYRRLAQMECAPFPRPTPSQGYSSDGDSEEE